jgi:hypothetical protein
MTFVIDNIDLETPAQCESPHSTTNSNLVRFSLRSGSQEAYLFIANEYKGSQARIPMQRDKSDAKRWSLTLPLRPGTYRYRYYTVVNGLMTYYSPEDSDDAPVRMDGLDAVLRVSARSRPATKTWGCSLTAPE